jgi:hypothetical protein
MKASVSNRKDDGGPDKESISGTAAELIKLSEAIEKTTNRRFLYKS